MADSAGALPTGSTGSPSDFLRNVVGQKVVVRLNSGVDYRGILSCLDGYMNAALENTEEVVNGKVTNNYGDAFVRGNNTPLANFFVVPLVEGVTFLMKLTSIEAARKINL